MRKRHADHFPLISVALFSLCALTAVGASEDDVPYLRGKWRGDVTDRTTGLGLQELKVEAQKIVDAEKDRMPWCLVKAHLFAMISDRMSVGFSPHDFFPAFACWSRKDRILTKIINARMAETDRRYCPDVRKKAGQVKGSCLRHDYDHAVPDWDRALALGFPGLKAEIDASPATNDFTRAMSITADAMLRNVRRFADCARRSPHAADPRVQAEIAALDQLVQGPPRTAYEAMMFQLLFFVYGEHVDHLQVRSLGNWDRLMLPYYEADLAAGRTTRAAFKEQVKHFWWQWGSIDNWWGQPVYIGGTKADGSTEYNEVSRIVLEVTDELALPTPKLQHGEGDGVDGLLRGGVAHARHLGLLRVPAARGGEHDASLRHQHAAHRLRSPRRGEGRPIRGGDVRGFRGRVSRDAPHARCRGAGRRARTRGAHG